MSSYRDKAIHPKTGEVCDAWFWDDYFGKHRYGVKFDDDPHVWPAEKIKLPPAKEAYQP